jgi:uncharacterized protein YlaN (UPF0358 family)
MANTTSKMLTMPIMIKNKTLFLLSQNIQTILCMISISTDNLVKLVQCPSLRHYKEII